MTFWTKAIIQKLISYLPGARHINHAFQVLSGRFGLSDQEFKDKLIHLEHHLAHFQKLTKTTIPRRVLELGTGWFPVLPIGLYLIGSEHIVTVDIRPHLTKKHLLKTLRKFLEWHAKGDLYDRIPELDPHRLEKLNRYLKNNRAWALTDWLGVLRIYRHVGDLGSLVGRNIKFNLIISNNTLEHIPEKQLMHVFGICKKLMESGSVSSHFIDMSDHYSHLDPSISNFHFLKFSDRTWKLINNSIQPQNRLRIDAYRTLFKTANHPVAIEIVRNAPPEDLEKVRLAKIFRAMKQEDILVTHAYLAGCLHETQK